VEEDDILVEEFSEGSAMMELTAKTKGKVMDQIQRNSEIAKLVIGLANNIGVKLLDYEERLQHTSDMISKAKGDSSMSICIGGGDLCFKHKDDPEYAEKVMYFVENEHQEREAEGVELARILLKETDKIRGFLKDD